MPLSLVVALILLVLAGAAPLRADADDGLDVRISGIEDDAIRDNVRATLQLYELAEGEQAPSESRIRELHAQADEQIRRALRPFGYYRPRIRSSLERDEGGRWLATYRIDPGPALRLSRVDVRVAGAGRDDPAFRRAVDEFPLEPGERIVSPDYERGKQRFFAVASRQGYLDARFDEAEIRIDLERYTAAIDLTYDTGMRYRFGEVRFQQHVLRPDLLRRFVDFEVGAPIDRERLLALQGALGDTPWFSQVEVRLESERAEGLAVPVEVDLVPAKPQRWRVGAGYGTDSGPRGSLGLDLRRLNRDGHQASVDLLASAIEQSFESRYVIPGPRPRTDEWAARAGYRLLDTTTSESQTAIVGASLGRKRCNWREAFALDWQRETFEVGVDEGTSNLLLPQVGWTRVEADDRIYAEHGYRMDFGARAAHDGALSNASLFQITAGFKRVQALTGNVRAHGRLDLGWTATDDFRSLPPSLRFFAGGDRSVRGFEYQTIGPVDEEGNVIGGDVLVSASLELDWLFFERWGRAGIGVFHDWGDAASGVADLALEPGAGAGLRWVSPIGLVRADVGFAYAEPGSPARFHLTVGPEL